MNARLLAERLFGDPALPRRGVLGPGLVTRARDGSAYRRRERRLPAEARALIRLLEAQRAAGRGLQA